MILPAGNRRLTLSGYHDKLKYEVMLVSDDALRTMSKELARQIVFLSRELTDRKVPFALNNQLLQ